MSGEVVVIGAGVNGLACAALLGRAGRAVTLVERREVPGGLAVGEDLPGGGRADGPLHDTSGLRPELVQELGLESLGLELAGGPAPVFLPGGESRGILLHHDAERAAEEIGRVSPEDAASYRDYRAFFDRIGPAAERFWREPMPDPWSANPIALARQGVAVRRLGNACLRELARLLPMSVADWLEDRFTSPLLRAGLAFPAVAGSFCGPRSPGTGACLARHETGRARAAQGGPRAVVAALEAAARKNGVKLRTGASVRRIECAAGRVRGVELESGERLEAEIVAASCDPKTALLRLLEPGVLEPRIERKIRAFRQTGTAALVDLVLDAPLRYASSPDRYVEHARVAETPDDLERAFDPVKYGRHGERPALDVRARGDEQAGGFAVSILAHFVPFSLEGGWTDAARDRLGDVVLATLERHAPGVSGSLRWRRVYAPPDIEAVWGTLGGHVHHGDHSLDQLLARPCPECAGNATPVGGLWLCGGGSGPGGGLTGAPGRLAAQAIM